MFGLCEVIYLEVSTKLRYKGVQIVCCCDRVVPSSTKDKRVVDSSVVREYGTPREFGHIGLGVGPCIHCYIDCLSCVPML